MQEKVGFIGIGNIGTPMSLNVLRAGYPLVVFDARRAQMAPLLSEGAEAGISPKDVAARCKTILLSLPNSPVVEQVTLGKDSIIEGAAPDTVVVDLTSGNPPHTAAICARLAEKGIHFIDAGVSGGIPGAEAATLGIMIGGDAGAFERVRPILEKIGSNLYHMGPIGAGHMTKALNNFLAAANLAAASEALVVATKAGLDPEKVVAAINASSGRSWATEQRIPNFVLKGDFSYRGGMAMELIVKDLATACGIGKDQGVPMFIANLMHQLLMRISDEIGAKTPNIAVARAFEQWAGVEVRGASHRSV
jgi:3-hydroxyisobutyrate dehydrogenase-like beta-hydroxyacid dehydrogenase